MPDRQLQELLLVVVVRSEFQLPFQPDGLLRVYTHSFLESKQRNFSLRLIVDPQCLDAVDLDTRLVRIERRSGPFTHAVFHELQKVPVYLKKLLDKHQIAYRRECFPKTVTHLSREQALLIGYTMLRGVFLILGDFRATGTTSVEFQWQHATDVEAVIPSIHFLESTKSKRWVLPHLTLRPAPFPHLDL